MKDIRNIFRKNLKEALADISDEVLDSRKTPVIWIAARSQKKHGEEFSPVENIFRVGFDRAFAGQNGTMFGEGVYSSYYLNGALDCVRSGYGDAIVMCKVPDGYDKYLIFTQEESMSVNGNKWTIEDQLRKFTKDESTINLFKDKKAYDVGNYYQNELRKIGVMGIIYDWNDRWTQMPLGGKNRGHVCVLPFDFKSIVPYKVSFDNGNTFEKKFDATARRRFEQLVDPVYLLKNRYDKRQIGSPVYVPAYGFSFVPIKKGYNRVNLVELGSKEMREVSPIDFESMTAIVPDPSNPETMGFFFVDYRGKSYRAWPWSEEAGMGYFQADESDPDSLYTFDDLPNIAAGNLVAESEEKKAPLYHGEYHIPTKENIQNCVADPRGNNKAAKKGGFIAFTVTHKEYVENIFRSGFNRSFRGINDAKITGEDRSWYGDGVYCNIKLDRALESLKGKKYGDTLLEVVIIGGLNRYLIFDEVYAKAVYGEKDYSIKHQVYTLFPKDVADNVWRDMERVMASQYMAREDHHFRGQTSILPQYLLREKYVGTKQRDHYEKLFSKYKIRGIVYTGGNDGLCVVPYDFSSAVPIAVYNPELKRFEQSGSIVVENYGRYTQTKEQFNFDYDVFYDRILNNQDDGHKFGYKFDRVDASAIVKGINLDGEETSFRLVKRGGAFNYVDVKKGEAISPIDFSSVTMMSPEHYGYFNFTIGADKLAALGIRNAQKISKITFDAASIGFRDPYEGEQGWYDDDAEGWYTYDELEMHLKNIDANMTNTAGKPVDMNNPLGNQNDTEPVALSESKIRKVIFETIKNALKIK